MARILITGGRVFAAGGIVDNGEVQVEGSRITRVGPGEPSTRVRGADVTVIDATGLLVLPGFIDIQVNGAGGRLFTTDPTLETLAAMSQALARTGCTAFLPAVMSAPMEDMAAAARAAALATETPLPGSRVLGCHLEGPFLNPSRAGAHRREWIRPPNADEVKTLLDAGEGGVRLVTLAPELPGAEVLIDQAVRQGARVGMGHTDATVEHVRSAVEAGATLATHLFNAMPPITARAPGIAGAALAGMVPFASIIADTVHVHPSNLAIASRAMGPEHLVLVTDAMPPVGTEMDTFDLQGRRVSVRGGACYLEDGTLAGSGLTMNAAVRNMRAMAGVTEAEAVSMASFSPARVLGISDRKGSLAQGMDADLAICSPDYEVLLTMVAGNFVHRAPGWRGGHGQ